jgi:hypothetical protein
MFMNVSAFKALTWRKQNAALEPYVQAIRRTMKEPWPTRRLMLQLANDLGWLDEDYEYLPRAVAAIGAVLRRYTLHPPYPGMVIQNGETFEAYGREMVRYMWQPEQRDDKAIIDDVFS